MTTARLTLLAALLLASGCSGGSSTPTSPSATEPSTILFSGTLLPLGTRFYSYTLASGGTVTALLASLEQGHTPMPHALELGLGVPAGTGCAVTIAQQTTTSLSPQLRQEAATGTYCVRLSDTTGLPAPMNFTIRVIHP